MALKLENNLGNKFSLTHANNTSDINLTSKDLASTKLVDSIAELRLISGSTADKLEVLGYYEKGDGGGGTFYWDATSTEDDNGGTIIQATGVTTGRWKRVFSGAVNVSWFGAVGDGITDDTDALIAFMAAPFKDKELTAGKTYLTSSQLEMESNTILDMKGATLKAYDAGSGFTNGYTSVVKAIIGWVNKTNSFVKNGNFNGNSAVFGGRTPDSNTGTHGCLVWTGNTNVGAIDCTADDCSLTGFIHLSNGALGQSNRVFWVRCFTDNSGIGFGQEILFAGGTGGLHGVSPGDTYYIGCRSGDNCNFGLYIAGGEHFEVHGCHFASTRNDTVTLYTGDAQGVLRGRFYGGVIDSSTRANSNKLLKAHSVNIQPVNVDQYLNSSILDVEFHGVDFKGNPLYNQIIEVAKNCNIKFFGGNVIETKVVGVGAVTGAVGVTSYPLSILSTGFEDCPTDYALSSVFPIKCYDVKFSSVVSGVDKAIHIGNLGADGSTIAECKFGSGRVGEQMQYAITTGVPVKMKVYGNDGSEMVGAKVILYSTTANSSNIKAYDNTPEDQFDMKKWRQVTGVPAVGTWRAGDIVWNKTPTAGGSVGWICVTSGTPGTWKTFGTISA